MSFFINPKRKKTKKTFRKKIIDIIAYPFIKIGTNLGFQNIEYSYVHGDPLRVLIGEGCSTANAIFNVMSGTITLGNNTILGHDVMILTGTHRFYKGTRAKLCNAPIKEVPDEGRDVYIGEGCFVGSRAVIIGPIHIGDNVIVGAGSVVTKDLPDGCFAAGVPARVLKLHGQVSDTPEGE